MKDEKDYNITTKLSVEFKRKNKIYNKDIFILMNTQMKKNICSEKNLQFFSDITYQCVPPQNARMKLFVILAYNKNNNKTLLCVLALISNENY